LINVPVLNEILLTWTKFTLTKKVNNEDNFINILSSTPMLSNKQFGVQ